MDVSEALQLRKSTRAFLDKDLSEDMIRSVLDAARHAPSGANTQPWQVAVVRGKKKQEVQDAIIIAFNSGEKPAMDYLYYPVKWEDPYKQRRKECALQLYQTLEIVREDKERQKEQWVANYRSFDAPVVMFFFMDAIMEAGSFMDCGMFIQSVMLAAVEQGLAVCPQASLGEFPKTVKEQLGYPDDSILLCGMALGYEDTADRINSYRTPREEVRDFTKFFE